MYDFCLLHREVKSLISLDFLYNLCYPNISEKSGIPVAAIISAEDLKRLDQLEKERAGRFRILDEVKAAFRDIPEAKIENEADQALTRVRQITGAREK